METKRGEAGTFRSDPSLRRSGYLRSDRSWDDRWRPTRRARLSAPGYILAAPVFALPNALTINSPAVIGLRNQARGKREPATLWKILAGIWPSRDVQIQSVVKVWQRELRVYNTVDRESFLATLLSFENEWRIYVGEICLTSARTKASTMHEDYTIIWKFPVMSYTIIIWESKRYEGSLFLFAAPPEYKIFLYRFKRQEPFSSCWRDVIRWYFNISALLNAD